MFLKGCNFVKLVVNLIFDSVINLYLNIQSKNFCYDTSTIIIVWDKLFHFVIV